VSVALFGRAATIEPMVGPRRVRPLLLLPLLGIAALSAGVAGSARAGADSGPSAAAADHRAQAGASQPQATDSRRRRRPGCGRFCRQAGGFGAPPEDQPQPVRIPRQRVRVADDWIFAVRATCRLTETCIGAIIVAGRVEYGRADLRIPAGATRRVLVGVSARGRRSLRRHGRDRRGFATVPLINDDAPVSISSTLTILAPR
jgi:hypothetical protein